MGQAAMMQNAEVISRWVLSIPFSLEALFFSSYSTGSKTEVFKMQKLVRNYDIEALVGYIA